MTECYEKHLFGTSTKILANEGIVDNFDLFIFTVGWESRCTEITKYSTENFTFDSTLILSFKPGGEKGYHTNYMDKIRSLAEEKSIEIHEIESDPNNLGFIGEKIEEIIKRLIQKLNRPLIIGFDITSCPRYFFLHFLAFCLKHNLSKRISFFYSEGEYKTENENFIHTKGEWEIIEIPTFESEIDPEYRSLFVASVGFKGRRCKSLLSKYEPHEIGILLPVPGYNEKYTNKAKKECSDLREDFFISDENIAVAPAGDAIAAWESLKKKSLNKEKHRITYLTLGPKPHVLAMGIHGFLNRYTLTYRIPEGYTKIEVESNGVVWKYDIKNLIFL